MDFWGCFSGVAGCSETAVCVVRAAGANAKRNGFVCPIMRTALAVCVATVAKWISGAASLGVQAVPERQFVSSRAAGTGAKRNGFVCPIMRTALAASVAAAAKWLSGAASLGLQAVPERQFVSSRAAGADAKRNGFVCPIMRTALAASVATVAKWISGAASLGVQVVPERRSVSSRAAGTNAKRNGFVCPIMRTALAVCVAAAAKWISGAAPLGVQAVPERWSMWSRAAGADAKRNGFVCPIMKTALAVRVAAAAKWISGAASLGVQAVPERRSV